MPESQQPIEGQKIMINRIVNNAGLLYSVIDVGAGDGKWGRLLKGLVRRIVAIEIWPKCVEKYKLNELYDEVMIRDARQFEEWDKFDVVILGDVLEHVPRADALELIEKLKRSGSRVYLTTPITPCPQNGTVYKNPHETHLDQWTHEELEALGWVRLHEGLNPNGKVMIGTYMLGDN